MSSEPIVTIGVPVYQGKLYIEETLKSIQDQTYSNIEVLISIDGPQPIEEDKCQPFLKDSRFRIVVHPERLGWVDNVNWLMKQAETPYWYCHPQDDLIDPNYVEILLAHAQQTPEAAVVYCDIVSFGLKNDQIVQPSITGDAPGRQLTLLHEHFNAVAFRGLTRIEALRHSGDIHANEIESFGTDTVWMAAMARWGELVRVPLGMYHKRYHTDNEHTKWMDWSAEKITRAWIIHCADMLEQAMLIPATPQERRLLWLAAVTRLSSPRFDYSSAANLRQKHRKLLLNNFIEYIHQTGRMNIPKLLADSWEDINRWTGSFSINKRRITIRKIINKIFG